MTFVALPVDEDNFLHTDAFDPLSDDATGLTGEYLDEDQSEPDLGSTVELGGQDTTADTLTVASGASSATTQNLTGQSDSPPAVSDTEPENNISGTGTAAGTVPTGSKMGDTTVLSAMNTLGPSLATGVLTTSAQTVTSPQTSNATAVTLVQTSQSGLSFGANIALFVLLSVAAYFIAERLFD